MEGPPCVVDGEDKLIENECYAQNFVPLANAAYSIYLSKKMAKGIEQEFSRFIWRGRKPRLSMKTLQLPKEKGGLAFPNIRLYNWACHGRLIHEWIHCYLKEKDDPLESWGCAPYRLLGEVMNRKIQTDVRNNPILLNSLKTWRDVTAHAGKGDTFSYLTPIQDNRDFLNGIKSAFFRN